MHLLHILGVGRSVDFRAISQLNIQNSPARYVTEVLKVGDRSDRIHEMVWQAGGGRQKKRRGMADLAGSVLVVDDGGGGAAAAGGGGGGGGGIRCCKASAVAD